MIVFTTSKNLTYAYIEALVVVPFNRLILPDCPMKHSVRLNSELIFQNHLLASLGTKASHRESSQEFIFCSSRYKWSEELTRQMCDVEIYIVQHFSMTESFFFFFLT